MCCPLPDVLAMMYYKATRPDGTDFRTGTIDYALALVTGEVVRHPVARKVRNEPATYIPVSVAPADCTGMRWPCRLFHVEPIGPVLGSAAKPLAVSRNKRACSALRVVGELPAWQALGPNGELVAAFITGFASIDWVGIGAAAGAAARDAAWAAAWAAA